jgi:hypothetical protein
MIWEPPYERIKAQVNILEFPTIRKGRQEVKIPI